MAFASLSEATDALKDVLEKLNASAPSGDGFNPRKDSQMSTLTMDDVTKMVNDRMSGMDASNARSLFIARNMADLPDVYASQMPQTSDPKVLAAAEQTIRKQFRADFGKAATSARVNGHLPPNMYDPDALAKAAASAADPRSEGQLATDRKAMGGGIASDADAPSPAAGGAAPVDYSKMSDTEKILAGINESKSARGNYVKQF